MTDTHQDWLTSGNPVLVRAARDRIARIAGHVSPPPPEIPTLHSLALRCPARGPLVAGCGCARCRMGQGEAARGYAVDAIVCLLCVRALYRALPAPA